MLLCKESMLSKSIDIFAISKTATKRTNFPYKKVRKKFTVKSRTGSIYISEFLFVKVSECCF
jgi:hypothetical protein